MDGISAADRDAPTRFLMVCDEWFPAHGGISTLNRQLSVALAACGAEVTCYVLEASPAETADADLHRVTLVQAPETNSTARLEPLMRRPPLSAPPHVIVGHGRITGPHAESLVADHFQAAARFHILHMTDEIEFVRPEVDEHAGIRAEANADREFALARTANRSFGIGPVLQRWLQNHLRPDPPPWSLLPITPGFDSTDRPATRPGDDDAFQILLSGRLQEHRMKGLDVAAAAIGDASRITGDQRRIGVLLRGAPFGSDAVTIAQFHTWAGRQDLGVTPRPYTTDDRKRYQDLRRASLVLMPSREEGFGLIGSEAVAAGVPVLISARSGLGTLLQESLPDEMHRHLVLPVLDDGTDASTWGNAVAAVLDDRRSAFDRMDHVRRLLAAKYTWKKAARVLLREAEALRAGGDQEPHSAAAPSARIYQFPGPRPAPTVPDRWAGFAAALRQSQFPGTTWEEFALRAEPVLAHLVAGLPVHPSAERELRYTLGALRNATNRALDPAVPGHVRRAAAAECERLRSTMLRLLAE